MTVKASFDSGGTRRLTHTMLGKQGSHGVIAHDPTPNHRDALLLAAVAVVAQAETSAVTMAEIASAAGVDVDVASALFESVDELLIEAALRQAATDLKLDGAQSNGAPTVSAFAHHFAARRPFYRAMRIGPVAAALDARMAVLVAPLISVQLRAVLGPHITDDALAEMTVFATAESFRVTNGWIVGGADTDGAEALYVLLEGIVLSSLELARAQRDES